MAFLRLDHAAAEGAFQIVATLGPASLQKIAALAAAGATSFRLNASHLALAQLEQALAAIDAAAPGAPVVVDLQGAKMRLGRFEDRPVGEGDAVAFSLGGDPAAVPLPHPELFQSLRPGDTLGCDDDRLRFRVERVLSGRADTRALREGVLRQRKGVNLLEHPVALDDLPAADVRLVAAARERAAFALSFMTGPGEAAWLRSRAPRAALVGKVERREVTEALAPLAGAVDAVWICRGDLGAQLGAAEMARFVGSLDPRRLPRPVLMAGQVLEHLTHHAQPTRSEVCHLHDLVGRGYAGVVLSDETAVGADPVRAVATAAELAHQFLATR